MDTPRQDAKIFQFAHSRSPTIAQVRLGRTPPRTLRRPTTLTEPFTNTVEMASAELANAYAALILADDGVEITVRTMHPRGKVFGLG